jgi:DNA-binding LytR/AlgR family response regulator
MKRTRVAMVLEFLALSAAWGFTQDADEIEHILTVERAGAKECHMLRETMTAMMERLDPGRFVRIHRCTIVNLEYVRELRSLCGGGYTVFMRDGTQLALSRTYRSNLKAKSLSDSDYLK